MEVVVNEVEYVVQVLDEEKMWLMSYLEVFVTMSKNPKDLRNE